MKYPDLDALPPEMKKIIADKRGANVYKMLMHSQNVASGFTAMADAVMWSPKWPATLRELSIVRVGHHYAAPYEIHHHEQIGKMVGLSDAKLAACKIGADQTALSADEKVVLRLTDALVTHHTLTPNERGDALRLLDTNGLADFVMTVGFYQLVCNFLNAFEVEIEPQGLASN
jgi:alkylhydroperoxidase family enzyme